MSIKINEFHHCVATFLVDIILASSKDQIHPQSGKICHL